ncbi:MAG: phosphomannomutase/phosphoglucomutase, partial [Luteimonas sp.]
MSETEPHKLRLLLVQAKPLLLPLALASIALALWLAWTGWQLMQDGARRRDLQASRDAIALATGKVLASNIQRFDQRLASPEVQSALEARDLAAAGKALGAGWNGVEETIVLPMDLTATYSQLPKSGFGRTAVLEAALAENKTVSWIVRDGGSPRLALAAPARSGETLAGIAYVRLPLSRVTVGLDSASVADDTYLALRQGGVTLLERGDAAHAEGAERMAVPVPNSDLRIAAAVPNPAIPLFGLSDIASLIAAAIFAALGYMLFRLSRKDFSLTDGADAVAPTLAQVITETPAEAKTPSVDIKDAPKPAAIKIDRGIFRAYDIRGVVGESLDVGVAELIGQAVGTLMKEKNFNDIVVGRDGRLSGPDLVGGLIEGLRRAGRNVIDIGMAPTPVIYFGAFHLRTGCCISVTGSHNPPDYNGFKIVVGGETLSGDAITDLHSRIAEDRLHEAPASGAMSQRDIGDDYVARIAS